jgi:hypothetical protein
MRNPSFDQPVHAPEWSDPGIDAAFEEVWQLLLEARPANISARSWSAS